MASVTFPKIGEKHRLSPLYTPDAALGQKYAAGVPGRAVFIYGSSLESVFSKELGLYSDRELARHIVNPYRIKRSRTVKNLLVLRLGIGAPLTAVVADELYAVGVKDIVIMGIAGAISKKLRFGDIVICNKAVRDEGTSHHYLKNSMYANPTAELTRRLEGIAKKLDIEYAKGPTWTIDASYAETAHEVVHYRKKGVLTVEMEAAALFAVAMRRNRSAAAVFTVSDILDPDGWSGFSEDGKRIRKRYAYPSMAKMARAFGSMK